MKSTPAARRAQHRHQDGLTRLQRVMHSRSASSIQTSGPETEVGKLRPGGHMGPDELFNPAFAIISPKTKVCLVRKTEHIACKHVLAKQSLELHSTSIFGPVYRIFSLSVAHQQHFLANLLGDLASCTTWLGWRSVAPLNPQILTF